MPIFEYQCKDCSREFETLVLAGPADTVLCPGCGSTDATRLVSTFGFVTRGGGSSAPGPSAAGSCCAGGGCSCRH